MSDYQVAQLGALDEWRDFVGGFRPETTKAGRRVVDHELPLRWIGMTANAMAPGEEAGYWHAHSRDEELYVFLAGRGQMALDDEVVDVGPGTTVRVGTGVRRTWRCAPDGAELLRWLCIRAGPNELTRVADDATPDRESPMPW
ncbi:cupin domain-containing protein [Microbacterium halophytorum]|uniref:cupin domain-containing protein n=1 Tax=Microbacterium halophytorum TaxID=2067568 RepID=UPI000CFAA71C|nr:cupin domain-containing protein [Microbacterium halophytorum]